MKIVRISFDLNNEMLPFVMNEFLFVFPTTTMTNVHLNDRYNRTEDRSNCNDSIRSISNRFLNRFVTMGNFLYSTILSVHCQVKWLCLLFHRPNWNDRELKIELCLVSKRTCRHRPIKVVATDRSCSFHHWSNALSKNKKTFEILLSFIYFTNTSSRSTFFIIIDIQR